MAEQVCPVCGGRGNVVRGFYNPHPYRTHNTTAPEKCRRCNGRGTIPITSKVYTAGESLRTFLASADPEGGEGA